MNKRDSAPAAPVQSGSRILAAMVLILLTIAVYLPSLSGGFILDDDLLITDNSMIKSNDGLYRFWLTTEPPDYWPLTSTTFWIEWRLWGMHPMGYHVDNLVLHIIEALILWRILIHLEIPGAYLAALLFAIHPVNVQSVAWVAQRKNLMAMLFYLPAILWYLKFDQTQRWKWYGLSLLACLAAMLGKGSAATLPAALLVGTTLERRLTRSDWIRIIPFILICVAMTVVNIFFQHRNGQGFARNIDLTGRFLGAAAVVWFYLYKALLPIRLMFVYPNWKIDPNQLIWWIPLIAAMAVTILLWSRRKTWGWPVLLAWVFFGAALAPVMGFTDVGYMKYALVSDHYQHIALIGIVTLGAAVLARGSANRTGATRAAIIVIVILLAGRTAWQAHAYGTPERLYRTSIALNPDSPLLHNNLGGILLLQDRDDQAMQEFIRATQMEVKSPESYYNLGRLMNKREQYAKALEYFDQAIHQRPNYPEVYDNMGVSLHEMGRDSEALTQFEKAIKLNPKLELAHFNKGNVLYALHQFEEARKEFEEALRLNPDDAEAHNNLGSVLLEQGQADAAMAQFTQAVQLKPDFAPGQYNLAQQLMARGQIDQAIARYRQGLKDSPDSKDLLNGLGMALSNSGKSREAIESLQHALRVDPDFVQALNNLAWLYATDPDPQLRNGAEALRLADHANQLTSGKTPAILDTLAAAYAQVGRFQQAVEISQKALALARAAGDESSASDMETRLKEYQQQISGSTAPSTQK